MLMSARLTVTIVNRIISIGQNFLGSILFIIIYANGEKYITPMRIEATRLASTKANSGLKPKRRRS